MTESEKRAAGIAFAAGTALQVAMVLTGHLVPPVQSVFAVGGTALAFLTGALCGGLAAWRRLAVASGWGALAGGLAGLLGVVVSLLLGDVSPLVLLIGGGSSAVAGALGALATAPLARRRAAAALMLLALGTFAAPLRANDDAVRETSYRLPTGERVLRHEAIVAAPREAVYAAFTTAEGLRSFAAPIVAIDLRIGGDWEATYDLQGKLGNPGNIHNEVLAFLPPEMLAIRVREAPPRFPHPEVVKQVWTVIRLEEAGAGRTRVVVSMLPYRDGADWDVVYGLFQRGNAVVMRHLQQRFATGKPVDWSAPPASEGAAAPGSR